MGIQIIVEPSSSAKCGDEAVTSCHSSRAVNTINRRDVSRENEEKSHDD